MNTEHLPHIEPVLSIPLIQMKMEIPEEKGGKTYGEAALRASYGVPQVGASSKRVCERLGSPEGKTKNRRGSGWYGRLKTPMQTCLKSG
jgi:hypothetical protein